MQSRIPTVTKTRMKNVSRSLRIAHGLDTLHLELIIVLEVESFIGLSVRKEVSLAKFCFESIVLPETSDRE